VNVGLIDIEPKIVNTAYMQIAAYHKAKGDLVTWWSPLMDRLFDVVYCSSLFDFTGKGEVPKRTICGGTGFDVSSMLSKAIEACDYDYSIYPECNRSIVWFSRGCIRKCPFCCVWKKEGNIKPVSPKPFNPNGNYVVVQDNNFFANPQWKAAIDILAFWDQPVDFQGIDARLLDEIQCKALLKLRHKKQIKIAWDDPRDDMTEKLKWLTGIIKPYRLMCYVLIGYWSTEEEDLWRVETLRRLHIDPFVMPFNKSNPYQQKFTRWVNMKSIFYSVLWKEYLKCAPCPEQLALFGDKS